MWTWLLTAALAAPADDAAEVLALHLRQDGVVVDQATLDARYQPLCDAGQEVACRWRAWDVHGRPKLDELPRLLGPLCAGGDHVACLGAAWGLSQVAPGVPSADAPDPQRAARLLRTSCEDGLARACTSLADLLQEGVGVDADAEAAVTLRTAACEDGDAQACWRLGEAGDEEAAARAASLGSPLAHRAAGRLVEGCAAGVVGACRQIVEGDGETADRLQAAEVLCHVDDDDCAALASLRRSSGQHGPPPSEAAAWGAASLALVDEGGLLLGWARKAWTDHAWVPAAAVGEVRIVAAPGVPEEVELRTSDGARIALPWSDCEVLLEAARGLNQLGLLPVAVDPDGAPTEASCLERARIDLRPDYVRGRLAVEPNNPRDTSTSKQVRLALAASADVLLACRDGLAEADVLDPLRLALKTRRDGSLKVKLAGTSRTESFDACVLAWARAVRVDGGLDVGVPLTAEAYLVW